jgi:predicted RNA binding protein YcfA (HicA-like mRNA interferase family)
MRRSKKQHVVRKLCRLGNQGPVAGDCHSRMVRPDTGKIIPIPLHKGKDVSVGVIRSIIDEIGVTLEEWLELQPKTVGRVQHSSYCSIRIQSIRIRWRRIRERAAKGRSAQGSTVTMVSSSASPIGSSAVLRMGRRSPVCDRLLAPPGRTRDGRPRNHDQPLRQDRCGLGKLSDSRQRYAQT